MTACIFREITKEETTKSAGRTKKEPPVRTKEDKENKQLEDKRNELRQKESR